MAIYPDDANFELNSTTYSMINKKPDKGFTYSSSFNSVSFKSQIGYERYRLVSRKQTRDYSISYTNISEPFKLAIENFFKNRGGEFETFEFDLSHVGESGIIIAKFAGTLAVRNVLTTGDPLNNFYSVSFNLRETY
jgi:hypothetical protein